MQAGWQQKGLAGPYPLGYMTCMITLIRSSDFDRWLSGVADAKVKARVLARLRSATFGNFGDCEPVGEGVSEMRIHVGPGYRVYFIRTGAVVYVLLTGGDKSSQKQDIARAKILARELKEIKP
jgi:putative addiction module killer protein